MPPLPTLGYTPPGYMPPYHPFVGVPCLYSTDPVRPACMLIMPNGVRKFTSGKESSEARIPGNKPRKRVKRDIID